MGLAAGVLGAGVLGAAGSLGAASIQASAAEKASSNQLAEFNKIEQTQQPFIAGGTQAFQQLNALTGVGGNPLTAPLTAPFQPTQAQLAATPGYQFTLQQGLLATQNANAAQGLGGGNKSGSATSSGPALKGATTYATGLASQTYQQQFQNYLAQNQQIYNMLAGQAATGEGAAAITGQQGIQSTQLANNYLTSGAAAQAAGIVGATNSIGGAASSTGLLLALQNGSFFGNNNSNASGNVLQPTASNPMPDWSA